MAKEHGAILLRYISSGAPSCANKQFIRSTLRPKTESGSAEFKSALPLQLLSKEGRENDWWTCAELNRSRHSELLVLADQNLSGPGFLLTLADFYWHWSSAEFRRATTRINHRQAKTKILYSTGKTLRGLKPRRIQDSYPQVFFILILEGRPVPKPD